MELELTHFGCYFNKTTFTFPETGLVLLEGASGRGKSSILRAINFVLFGDRRSSCISFGEKSCKVRMKYKNFEITRSKGPNKFTVIYEDEEYDGDSAQEVINEHFGRDFTITSYITQDHDESFFHLSSTERMSFLEKLAIGGIDVTAIKKKCSEKIRDRKKKLNERVGELKIVKEEYNKLQKPVEIPFPLGGKYSEIKIKNEETKRKKNELKLLQSRKLLVDLQTQKSNYEIKKQQQDQLFIQINTIEDELININLELKTLSLQDSDKIQKRIDYLRINKELLQTQTVYKNDFQQYRGLCAIESSQLQDKYDELNKIPIIESRISELKKKVQQKKALTKIFDRIIEIKQDLEEFDTVQNYTSEIEELEKQEQNIMHEKVKLKDFSIVHKCPKCSSFLKINNSKLELAETIMSEPKKTEKELDIELKKIRKEKNGYISSKCELENLEKELKSLECQKNNYDIDTSIDYDTELNEHNKELIEQEERKRELINLKRKIATEDYSLTIQALKRKLDIRQETIVKLEKELKKNEIDCDIPEKDDIDLLREILTKAQLTSQKYDLLNKQKKTMEDKLKKLKLQLDSIKIDNVIDYDDKIENIEINIVEYEKMEKEFLNKNRLIEEYMIYRKEFENYEKWKQKYEDVLFCEQRCRESLNIAETVLRKIKETESTATVNTIENINTHLQFYLEKFFTDPIHVEINAFEETKTGEKKPCINIKVDYKGSVCDIESLSGGERARVELAICLSINNMIGGKILLLDEVFSSLNEEYINEIIDLLKQETIESDKLIICIVHQAVHGSFDHVISLDG